MSLVAIAGITLALDGVSPFLDALRNVQELARSNNTIFHETSFDSFLRFVGMALGLGQSAIRALIYLFKALLAAATAVVTLRVVRASAFADQTEGRSRALLNAVAPILIFMTLASPIVWEHHGIFLALSFLLMLKRLERPSQWVWFGFAYLLEFLLPTFDFFPWSFGRLLAPLIILWLMWKTSAHTEPSPSFLTLNSWLRSFTG